MIPNKLELNNESQVGTFFIQVAVETDKLKYNNEREVYIREVIQGNESPLCIEWDKSYAETFIFFLFQNYQSWKIATKVKFIFLEMTDTNRCSVFIASTFKPK